MIRNQRKCLMFIFSKLVLILNVVVMAMIAPAKADIRVGIAAEPYAPFTSKDASGQWVGWEIDVMKELCAQLREKCEIVETAWDGIIPALNANKIDMIMASMSKTPKRKEVMGFSDTYYIAAVVMAGAKNGDKNATPEHWVGKTIGVQVSTIQAAYLDKYFARNSTIKTYQTQDEATADLAAGRIDGVLANALTLESFIASDQGKCCELKDPVSWDAAILGEGVGVGLRKDESALATKINSALKEMTNAGTLAKITAKYGLTRTLVTPSNE